MTSLCSDSDSDLFSSVNRPSVMVNERVKTDNLTAVKLRLFVHKLRCAILSFVVHVNYGEMLPFFFTLYDN